MAQTEYDLAVIGGGPGGYVAAIRAAQLGMNVVCIEEHPHCGGTCLRVGCIPSKALLESSEKFAEAAHGMSEHGVVVGDVQLDLSKMHTRRKKIVQTLSVGVNSLLKQNGITRIEGRATFAAPGRLKITAGDKTEDLSAKRILIATGSRPAPLPGVELDGDRVGTSTEALAYEQVPEHLVVIGAGYIGLELGSVWNRLGAQVTVLEALDRILPGMDAEMAKAAHKIFQKQGLQFQLEARVKRAAAEGDRCIVECENGEPIQCDRVLLAIGRVANTDQLGLENVGVEVDSRGEITVTDSFQTTADNIYAIGDCIRGPKLAHKASHEGIACVEGIMNGTGHVNYDTIPGVVYTHPEIATVGQTEEQLKDAEQDYRKGVFPFQASGRAKTLGDTDGMVKVLADAQTDRILGVHILGPRAGDLIAEAVATMEFGGSAEDLAHVCHAHPTLSETLGEASLKVAERAIHLPNRRR
jgi:dihydrolipoamide dehydrogenase